MRKTFLSQLRPSNVNLKVGSVLAIIALLLIGSAFTVFGAGGPPTITVIGVNPGSEVTLAFNNLPANDTFAVSMTSGGVVGAGPVVAHFNTGAGGFETNTFEILSDVRNEQKVTVRIDDGLGLVAMATFDNTVAFQNTVEPTFLSTANGTTTAVVPVTGATGTATPAAGATTPTVAGTSATTPTVAGTSATTPTLAATTAATSATTPTVAGTSATTPTVAATTAATSATTPTVAGTSATTPTVAGTSATTSTPAAGGTTPTVAGTTATTPTVAATTATTPTVAGTTATTPTVAGTSATTPTVAATTATTPTVAATTATTSTPAAGSTTATAVVPVTGATPGATVTPGPVTGRMQVLHVEQGGWVQVEILDMPLNTTFTVTVGAAGSQGFGGHKVADLDTGDSSQHISIFEIPIDNTADASLDLRVEAPGFLYLTTFANVNK